MIAIMKREFNAYFNSALGFVILAVFFLATGYFFMYGNLYSMSGDLTIVFSNMFTILMFIIPVLTMRLMSEDKKLKTDQILLTTPVSITSIVYGKFLAALSVFTLGVSITIVYGIILNNFGQVDWLVIFGNIVGLLLLGGAMISVGLFASALTENQLIAALGGFAGMLLIMMIDAFANAVTNPMLNSIISQLSLTTRYMDFTFGLFDVSHIIFFLSIIAVFNFFTIRVIEKRRWS